MSSESEADDLRVGTQEREDATTVLGTHFAEGRLATEEYEQRVTSALEAKTRAQLRTVFDDLPEPHPAFMRPPAPPAPPPAYPYAPPVRRPATEPVPVSDKSKVVAGVLQIVLPFGSGRFYTGHTGLAICQLLLFFTGIGMVWSIVDGILLLVNGGSDPYGRRLAS